MNTFQDFGIKTTLTHFVGDSIKISKILDKRIIVYAYKITTSKFTEKGSGKCLHLQIEFDNEKRVVFTSGVFLMDNIEKVPEDGFPFECTIKKINDHLEFT